MKVKQWNKDSFNILKESIVKQWKIRHINTNIAFKPFSDSEHPLYISNIGPICKRIIRKKYRIGTFGYITKVHLQTTGNKNIYTNCFWKELSLDISQSPINEIYATICASYLRHNLSVEGLAYCYGFVQGNLDSFTTERHTSSVIHISNPRQYGFQIKQVGNTYSQIERLNEPICLLSQEYFPLTFDQVMSQWKEEQYTDEQITKQILLLLLQIATGLHHMENEWGIRHNDLHLGNIVARKKKDGTLKWCIIDWGRSTIHREGCSRHNNIFNPDGSAYGQFKQTKFPLLPTSKMNYYNPSKGGDFCCLLVMLQKEPYIWKALTATNAISIFNEWLPKPTIKGDGLHVFRKANEWAKRNAQQCKMVKIISSLKIATQQSSEPYSVFSKLKTD